MASYYSHAYLTIAASRASNCEAGFLRSTESRRTRLLKCENGKASFDVVIEESHDTGPTAEIGNKLYTRAWAFQEILVSPRVISYGAKELEWYCKEKEWCECFDLVPQSCRPKFFHAHAGYWAKQRASLALAGHSEWLQLVGEFSRRKLTYQSDRLPALSALAQHFSSTLKAPYLAGLWNIKEDLWSGLSWSSHRVASLPAQYRAPSWSWASVEGQVNYDSYPSKNRGAHLLEAKINLRGRNPFGEVSGGLLKLSGCLVKTRLDITPGTYGWRDSNSYQFTPLLDGTGASIFLIMEPSGTSDYTENPRFHPDTTLELRSLSDQVTQTIKRSVKPVDDIPDAFSGIVHCLRLVPESWRGDNIILMLVLGCVDMRKEVYERIGICYMTPTSKTAPFFTELKPRTITII